MKRSIHTIVRNAVGAALALLVMTALPTGWLYDLRAGTGTEQGQKPGEGVERLERREDIEAFFLAGTPATVSGETLEPCPLARLRDEDEAGIHYYNRRGGRRSVHISEYIVTDYPIPLWQKAFEDYVSRGSYNRYYLTELEDGSWLCVYFDDYLVLPGAGALPTGYVRYATSEEKNMLARMAADHDVEIAYVLDMYRHGKVNWMLDMGVRFVVLIAAFVVGITIRDHWKKGEEEP